MVEKIVELLLEKGFFHKETYDRYGVLTSEQIQKLWLEATVRKKIDYSQLPYLLAPKEKNGRQKGGLNKENVDILPTQVKLSSENDDIFRQTKLNYILKKKINAMLRLKFRGTHTIRLPITSTD